MFGTAHHLFHWMFQASRNWPAISSFTVGMINHLAQLPRTGRERDGRSGIKLINDHGERIENYDLVFRELFCVAAVTLAERLKEHLTSVGVLWDEILPTGASGERPGSDVRKRQREIDSILQSDLGSRKESTKGRYAEDLAEKGMEFHKMREYGRGSLMFLVRQVESERDIANLVSAGFRFAEVRQVSSIIGSSMQIKAHNVEAKLKDMAKYASGDNSQVEPGVHIGFFGIRARVGNFGFEVLVRKGARNLLPSVRMPLDRLENWHRDFLTQLDRVTIGNLQRRLDNIKPFTAREKLFCSQLADAAKSLRDWIDDSIIDEAVLTPSVVTLPCFNELDGSPAVPHTLIAFRHVIPIHVNITSPDCEFIPLNFFKVHQLASKYSPYNLEFARSVHRELTPILNAVPAGPTKPAGQDRRSSFHGKKIPSKLRNFGRPSTSPVPVDEDGNPIPTVMGRASTNGSNHSGSTLKLWNGHSLPASPEGSSYDGPPAYSQTESNTAQPGSFGGIMVSQEITVDVHDASELSHNHNNHQGGHRRLPTLLGRRSSQSVDPDKARNQDLSQAEHRHTHGTSNTAIELKALSEITTQVQGGIGGNGPNSQQLRDSSTFVDELFAACIENR
jgi:hypothetical protein